MPPTVSEYESFENCERLIKLLLGVDGDERIKCIRYRINAPKDRPSRTLPGSWVYTCAHEYDTYNYALSGTHNVILYPLQLSQSGSIFGILHRTPCYHGVCPVCRRNIVAIPMRQRTDPRFHSGPTGQWDRNQSGGDASDGTESTLEEVPSGETRQFGTGHTDTRRYDETGKNITEYPHRNAGNSANPWDGS